MWLWLLAMRASKESLLCLVFKEQTSKISMKEERENSSSEDGSDDNEDYE